MSNLLKGRTAGIHHEKAGEVKVVCVAWKRMWNQLNERLRTNRIGTTCPPNQVEPRWSAERLVEGNELIRKPRPQKCLFFFFFFFFFLRVVAGERSRWVVAVVVGHRRPVGREQVGVEPNVSGRPRVVRSAVRHHNRQRVV